MTRRILAGFVGVLLALLALVVVPLGASLTSRERRDFQHAADATVRSLAAAAEERLGDRGDRADQGAFRLPADEGDGVVLLDGNGRRISVAGDPVSPGEVRLARAGRSRVGDDVVAYARVGARTHPDGGVVLVRSAEPLDHRIRALWLGLSAAAVAALALGAFVAGALARWINRPLRELDVAAVRMGDGDVSVRTDPTVGPPEVRDVASAFNDMADRIESLLDSHRTMTSEVSHQLRTPLAALRLRLELLADDAPPGLRSELGGALRELARLNRLTDGLLAVARSDEVAATPETIDVADITGQRLQLWAPVAQERDVTLESDIEPAWARATPGHLDQVLDNLLANALDALSAGDRVLVSVRRQQGDVVVKVADTGPGMPAEQRATAFTRFASDRAQLTKSGLGLTIVARLVGADRGSVDLAETDGGGLTVVVRLPEAKRPARVPGLRARH